MFLSNSEAGEAEVFPDLARHIAAAAVADLMSLPVVVTPQEARVRGLDGVLAPIARPNVGGCPMLVLGGDFDPSLARERPGRSRNR